MADALTNLQPASFEGVAFPVGELDVTSSNDATEHKALDRDGADVEPTGVNAERGRLSVQLYNDLEGWPADLFPRVYFELVAKFRRSRIGELQHPLLGTFRALVKDWSLKVDPSARDGGVLELNWIEHNASVVEQLTAAPGASSESEVEALAASADAAMAAADPAGTYAPTSPAVASTLDALSSEQRTHADVAGRLGALVDLVAADLELPAFAAVSAHDAVAALERLRVAVLSLRASYLRSEARAGAFTAPHDLPLWQVSVLVYGTVDGVATLLAANTVPDPTRIPRGAVLVTPPLGG